MFASLSRAVFFTLARSSTLGRLASRYGMRDGGFARRFIAGETLEDAIDAARRLSGRGLHCTLNYLGESVTSSAVARAATDTYAGMIRDVSDAGLPCQVSVKLTQLGLAIDPAACGANLRHVLDAAGDQSFVRIDMEQSAWIDPTLDLFEQVWREGYRNVGVVQQSYLYRTEGDLARLNALGASVRLCKGAYKEDNTVAYPVKADVNASFIRLMLTLVHHGTHPAFATHDPRIIDATRAYVNERGLTPHAFEFQMLYGVRRDLRAALREQGYRVRIYLPFGGSGSRTSCADWANGRPTCCSSSGACSTNVGAETSHPAHEALGALGRPIRLRPDPRQPVASVTCTSRSAARSAVPIRSAIAASTVPRDTRDECTESIATRSRRSRLAGSSDRCSRESGVSILKSACLRTSARLTPPSRR